MKWRAAKRLMRVLPAVVLLGAAAWGLAAPDERAVFAERLVNRYIHEYWQSKDGLPQNTVTSITQTADGYLWFATQEGLARFDGIGFKVFDQNNTPVLQISYIMTLTAARDGSLLVGTWKEGLYRCRNGAFERLDAGGKLSQIIIHCVLERADGSLWVGTDRGLWVVSQGRCERYPGGGVIPDDEVQSILETPDGSVWLGTSESGLVQIGRAGIRVENTASGLWDNRVWALAPARGASGFWAGTGTRLTYVGAVGRPSYDLGIDNPESVIRAIHQDTRGNIWVCTQNSGVRLLAQGKVMSFTTADGLTNNNLLSVQEDREGSVWIGTSGSGVNRLRERKIFSFTLEDGLTRRPIWSLTEGRDGSLWVGTNGGGLNRIHNGEVEAFTNKDGLRSLSVTSVCEARDGSYWIGTQGGGGLHHLVDGRITPCDLGANLQEKTIWSVFEDRSGTVWVGSSRGLFRLRGREVRKFTLADGLASDSVRYFAEAPDGTIWMAADGGLNAYKDGKFRSWTSRDGMPTDFLLCIYLDPTGGMWIGTQNAGLVYFKNGRFTTITTREGLFNNVAYSILDDGAGKLWISCNKGLFSVSRKELQDYVDGRVRRVNCASFGIKDGMKNNECNGGRFPSGIRTRDGKLCFPTMDGIAMVDVRHLPQNTLPPPVVIETVLADKREATPTGVVTIPPGRGELEISYAALSFVSPDKVFFQYKLEPYETEWVNALTRRTAFYTNLSPGRYTFRVRACNDDGLWNLKGVALAFDLEPHYYQTWWFKTLVALFFVLLLVWFIRLRVRRLQANQRKLEALVDVRTQQLKDALLKVEELANTDGLTGVANRRCFENWIDREWKRSLRNVDDISVILLDVDHFKLFNDNYGHLAGDDCLKKVAEVMRFAGKRATDLAGRYGGEEFILILPATPLSGAQIVAENIRSGVEALAIPHAKSPIAPVVTVSLGVSGTVPTKGINWNQIVALADQALYQAKETGRNRVCAKPS